MPHCPSKTIPANSNTLGIAYEVNEKSNTENEYIILQSNGSRDEGLVIKVIQPKIRGVAIVCEGGDSAYVQQRITQAVTAVLDIGASRVSIARMAD